MLKYLIVLRKKFHMPHEQTAVISCWAVPSCLLPSCRVFVVDRHQISRSIYFTFAGKNYSLRLQQENVQRRSNRNMRNGFVLCKRKWRRDSRILLKLKR
jgi:hypothetical protein